MEPVDPKSVIDFITKYSLSYITIDEGEMRRLVGPNLPGP